MIGGGGAGFVGRERSEEVGRQWVAISVWELRVSVADNGARNGVLFRAPVASCGSASAAWEVRRLPQWGHIAENAGAEACFIPHAAVSLAKGAIA